jgi:hypothetical protein
MAQVCGGSNFDFDAQRKHDAALKVLRRAADLWAMQGGDAVCTDTFIAILIRIYTSRLYGFPEGQSLEYWLSDVEKVQEDEVFRLLRAELSLAIEGWTLGNPEEPPTADALNAFECIFFQHGIYRRPPSPEFPKTLHEPA